MGGLRRWLWWRRERGTAATASAHQELFHGALVSLPPPTLRLPHRYRRREDVRPTMEGDLDGDPPATAASDEHPAGLGWWGVRAVRDDQAPTLCQCAVCRRRFLRTAAALRRQLEQLAGARLLDETEAVPEGVLWRLLTCSDTCREKLFASPYHLSRVKHTLSM